MAEPEYSIVERNLRATMKFFGQASGTGDVDEREGLLLIDSGVNYSVFNIAMLTSPIETAAELTCRIHSGATYFGGRNTRWSLWLAEEHLPPAVRMRTHALFASEQMRRLTEAPGMLAERLAPPARRLPAMEYRPVEGPAERADFAHITSVCFDIPFATCQVVYGNPQAWRHDYHGYVGYVDRTAVATAAVVVAADAIGLYSVATLPQHRRRGYAESLMRQVIGAYTKTTGIERTILQATRAGFQMYAKMGYRPVSHFTVYMS